MRAWITTQGGGVSPVDATTRESDLNMPGAYRLGRVRTWLGDEIVELIIMPRSTSAPEIERIQSTFPELAPAIGVFRVPIFMNLHGRLVQSE
jgi:hypothetical protein